MPPIPGSLDDPASDRRLVSKRAHSQLILKRTGFEINMHNMPGSDGEPNIVHVPVLPLRLRF